MCQDEGSPLRLRANYCHRKAAPETKLVCKKCGVRCRISRACGLPMLWRREAAQDRRGCDRDARADPAPVEGDRACAREVLLPGLRGHHASAGAAPSLTLACRSVAVGAVFGANRLPRGHDLGSNLPRGHIGPRKPRLIAVASSPNSPKTCSRFSGRHGSATARLSDGATGPHRTLRVTCLTIPGSSRQTTFRRARPRRWRRPCSRECSICRGHASSEPQWLRHRRRDPG